jgi:hypothetical protein
VTVESWEQLREQHRASLAGAVIGTGPMLRAQ